MKIRLRLARLIKFRSLSYSILKFAIRFLYPLIGFMIAALEPVKPFISKLLLQTYDDFRKGFRRDLWEVVYPDYTPRGNIRFHISVNNGKLALVAEKRAADFAYPYNWEGPMIRAKKRGYNMVVAKMMLDFDGSTAENGNIYIRGMGRGKRFFYLLGIDKTSKEVFFHCMDIARGCGYTRRGRAHFKDYFKDVDNKWLILGLEWTIDGVKYFAFEEGEKWYGKSVFSPPPEILEDVLKDCLDIYLYGLSEICIRTDIVNSGPEFKSITGFLDYVKAKKAPLSWLR